LTDATQRQQIQADHVRRGLGVLGLTADQFGDGLDLGHDVAGEKARAGSRIGQRLVLLIQALGRGQGAPGREAKASVGVALQRGQVIEQGRALALLLLVELDDLARLVATRLHDRQRLCLGGDTGLGPRVITAVVLALGVGRLALQRTGGEGTADSPANRRVGDEA